MNKGPVLQVHDTKSFTVKKGLDNQKLIFKASESTWQYFHNTWINLAAWVSLLFPKGKH